MEIWKKDSACCVRIINHRGREVCPYPQKASHDAKNISYNLDVKANARGYEQLATMGLKSTKRLS